MMFSLIVRSISRMTTTGTSLSSKCISSSAKKVIRAWMSTKSSYDSRKELPLLMLPRAIDTGNGTRAYMFYSPAENKVIMKMSDLNNDEVGLAGCSSHGWLVIHDKNSHNLFLYNPFSASHIELPSIGSDVPDKVIFSTDDDRAMFSSDYDIAIMCVKDTLDFCLPSRSTSWTNLNLNDEPYKDFVYSNKHKFLFCETSSFGGKIESWDLTDPQSPKIVWQTSLQEGGYYDDDESNTVIRYLLFADESDELFLVKRHMTQEGTITTTTGFDVFVIDIVSGKLRYVDGSFNGLSLFVGANNNIFALPTAAATTRLFSDSIYFTDKNHSSDIGIYNYKSGTISYYPCDNAINNSRSTWPLPAAWFTPSICSNSSEKRTTTPWMFLPPFTTDEVYQFDSLTDNKVKMVKKRGKEEVAEESFLPVECSTFIRFLGSSHGWLALQDFCSKELYLSNPISRHHIKLPSIYRPVKLVISGSSDDDEGEQVCAMLILLTEKHSPLAFCVPGCSTEWTRLPCPCVNTKEGDYHDLVYSSRHKLFFCMTIGGRVESWDLTDTSSPRLEWSDDLKDMGLTRYSCMIKSEKAGLCPWDSKHLVFDDHSNQLFLIIQHAWRMGPYNAGKAAGFDVYKIDDWEGGGRGRLIYMDGSLNGLSLFVGDNSGFALSAADFSGLKPDSIYYSTRSDDFGIYNYQNGTFSAFSDFQFPFEPSPLWFIPSSRPY